MPVLSMPTWVNAVLREPGPQLSQLVRRGAEGAEQFPRPAPRRTDKDATHDAGLVHVQAGATFDEGFHRHHPRAGGAAIAAPQAKSDTAARARRDRRRQRMIPESDADRSAGRDHVTQNLSTSERSPAAEVDRCYPRPR